MVTGRTWLAAAALALAAAPAALAAQTPASPCGAYERVRDGDTLDRIAERCGITLPQLLAANPAIRANEDLRAGGQVTMPAPGMTSPTPQDACGGFYTVRTGDTLEGIARKCGLTVPLLVAANGPIPEPFRLRVGSTLRIPPLPRAAVADPVTWIRPPAAVDPRAVAVVPEPADPEPPAPAPDRLARIEGVLIAAEPCLLLRTDDGQSYALDGRIGDRWRPGQRIVVLGLAGDPNRCDHEPTVDVRIVHRP